MAEQEKSKSPPTFEEVVARTADIDYGSGPRPDRPYYTGGRPYGDDGHVNPAITDTPLWAPQPERVVVPVVNDPGVLGGAPALADLNRAARADDSERGYLRASRTGMIVHQEGGERVEPDDTEGMTEDQNREEIRASAQARMERLKTQEEMEIERANRAMEANAQNAEFVKQRMEQDAEFERQAREQDAQMRQQASQRGGGSEQGKVDPAHEEAERKRREAAERRRAERDANK